MRFSELHLLRYGRFENCRLAFPAASADLHIVYGPNEAGKSTTLSAVNDLLFGFPHITPFDFRFDTKLLRIGAMIIGDGGELACVRKKGRSGTLLDPAERVLDEGLLAASLAGYSADGFSRMFSLDHRRLREGGRAILAASDDVGQAIFAAGSGLIGVTAVLARLEEEARTIWATRKSGDRRYHQAEKAFDEARARQKAAQIRPAAWDDLNRQIRRLDDEIAGLERRRGEAAVERERVERCRRVAPYAVLYRGCEAALAAIGDLPAFPSDAAATLEGVEAEVAAATFEARRAADDCVDLRARLASIVVDPRLIGHAVEIDALRETKGAVDKSLSDLPRRHADLRVRRSNLESHQRELGWPLEDAAGAKARLPQRVRVAAVREHLERRGALEATLGAAVDETQAAAQRVALLEEALAERPSGADLTELSAGLKFAKSLGDIEATTGVAGKEADRRRRLLDADLARLAPWEGDVEALAALVLPSEAETASAIARTTRAQGALADANRALQAASGRKSDLELRRKQLLRGAHAVAPAAVEAARAERDDVWEKVKAHLLDERALPDLAAAVDGLETRTAAADALADQRYDRAEQSATLAALEDEIEAAALAIGQATQETERASAAVATCAAEWTLAGVAGLALTPEAFGAWRDRCGHALESARALEDARQVHETAQARCDEGRRRLLEGLRSVSAPIDPDARFGRLLEVADRIEETGLARAAEGARVEVELKEAKLRLKRAEDKASGARMALRAWGDQWVPVIAAAALSADASHSVVRAQLELIETVRAAVDDILALEQRIRDMEQDVADFDDAVLRLTLASGFDTGDGVGPTLLIELAQALTQAGKLDAQATALKAQLTDAETCLVKARLDEDKALARLAPLTLVAGIHDREELKAVVQAFERARAIRQDLARYGEDIVKAGAGPGLDTLLAEADGADTEALTPRGQELTDVITALSDRLAELSAERATAHADVKRLDAGPDAAVAAADAEQAKAEMAAQAEAYARKRAEIVLLKWAIARYRSEKQAPLLKRASVIFTRLTLGRYCELLVDLESDKARLAGLTEDRKVVPVEGMSEGTVDQLFLALRLAAVEEAVDNGCRLPFLADDLFINYDDARSAAGFQVLAELAQKTQVLFFTHHQHLIDLAQQALGPAPVRTVLLAELQ
jgi:uncharacterized protein YhaN